MALPWNNKTGGNQRKIKSGMARPPEPPPIIYLRPRTHPRRRIFSAQQSIFWSVISEADDARTVLTTSSSTPFAIFI